MLTRLRQVNSQLLALQTRSFAPSERQRERRYRVNSPVQKLRNFTKHAAFQEHLNDKTQAFKE
jgi:hypothetical protein